MNVVGKYRLGDRIGKGGFGEVFYAQNHTTGDFVAIKRVPLQKMQKEQLSGVLEEINLLKILDDPNIVRYIDTVKTDQYLHIVLEYVENGSLADIVSRFGPFSENLCAVYISQVLKGLRYLHKQGVIHRDIKGANILTTKDGQVKLADFGIAVRKSQEGKDDVEVIGTPYWMAPEIIQMSGLTTACDIWSVGCTVIELLQGQPPYFDLAPMRALYRIVQDAHPPLPSGISFACSDFLMLCFQKEPSVRTDAENLLRHAWISQRKRGSTSKKTNDGDGDSKETKMRGPIRVTEADAKKYLSRGIRNGDSVPDDIREAVTNTIRLYHADNTDRGGSKSGEASVADVDVAVDWGDDDADDGAEKLRDVDDRFATVQARHETVIVASPSAKETPETLDDDDWGADFGETPTTSTNVRSEPDTSASSSLPTSKVSRRVGDEDEDEDDWGGDFDDDNALPSKEDNTSDSLVERMNSALRSNVVTTFEDDDLFDDVDFREEQDRDLQAKQSQEIVQLLSKMTTVQDTASRVDVCNRLRDMFEEAPMERNAFFLHHGATPLMAILEQSQTPSRAAHASDGLIAALRLVNTIVRDNQKLQEKLSMVGLIPVMCRFASEQHCLAVRLEAAKFVRQLCNSSDLTLQMFVACGGLAVLADFVPSKYEGAPQRELAHVAIDGAFRAFALRRRIFATEFSRQLVKQRFTVRLVRLFVHVLGQCLWSSASASKSPNGASSSPEVKAVRKALALARARTKTGKDAARDKKIAELEAKLSALTDHGGDRDTSLLYAERASSILMHISKCDRSVKEKVGTDDDFVTAFMQALRLFLGDPAEGKTKTQVVMNHLLRTFLHLSMEPTNLDHFAAHGAVEAMVQLLAEVEVPETYGTLLQITFYLCRLSRPRILAAANAGLVPHLQKAVEKKRHAKQFAVPILCEMAYIKGAREELWKHHVAEFYVELLHDTVWRHLALASLQVWAKDDMSRIESVLMQAHNLESLISFTREVNQQDLIDKDLLNPLEKLMSASARLSRALSSSGFFVHRLLGLLMCKAARVRKAILMMLNHAFQANPPAKQMSFMLKHNLFPVVGRMAKEEAKQGIVIVARVANKLLVDFNLCIERATAPALDGK